MVNIGRFSCKFLPRTDALSGSLGKTLVFSNKTFPNVLLHLLLDNPFFFSDLTDPPKSDSLRDHEPSAMVKS